MGRQGGALAKRKTLDFLWLSWLTEVIITEKSCRCPSSSWVSVVLDSSAQFAAGVFMGKAPSSLPGGDVPQKCRIEAGSYQTPRRSLLWTSEIVTQMFTAQEPSDPLPAPQRGCVLSWAAALPLGGKRSPKGSRGCERWLGMLREAAPGSKPTVIPDERQEKEGKKGASLTSLLPLPFFF